MELFVLRKTDVKKLISLDDKNGDVFIDDVYEINTKSQDTLLKMAMEKSDPDKFTIVLYCNLVSILTPQEVTNYIKEITDTIDFDVFYLNRYADECRAHDDFKKINNITTMKVKSPHGIDALILSPSGKFLLQGKLKNQDDRSVDIVLNSLSPSMNNYSSWPLIYNFNMEKRTNAYELIKCVPCRESAHSLRPPSLTQKNTSSLNLFWFIMVLIFIFCIIGALFTLMDKEEGEDKNDNAINQSSENVNSTAPIKIN